MTRTVRSRAPYIEGALSVIHELVTEASDFAVERLDEIRAGVYREVG